MAGQEGSNNNKGEASIPKYQYKRPLALTRAKLLPDLFMPRAVSLGPVYHKGKNLLVTKDDKLNIKEVLVRKNAGDFDSDEMKDALNKARDLYEGKDLDDDFDEMMILDACFIIHVIDHFTKEKSEVGKSEVLDERPHLLPLILEDMFLLENQVPIMVLKAAMKVLGRKYPKDDIDRFVEKIAQSLESPRTFSDMLMDLPWPFQFLVFLLLIPITPAILLVLLVVVLPLSLILLVLCLPLGGLVWVMCRVCCCAPTEGGNGNENLVDPEQPKYSKDAKKRVLTSGQKPSHNANQVDPEQPKKKDSNAKKKRELTSGQKPSQNANQVDPKQQEESNLLGCLRAQLLGCESQHAATHDNMRLPPRRATELTDAGIKFHRSPTSSVTFKEGVIHGHLFLPSLAQLTKTRLVNLMVYELCQVVGGYGMITSYVSFLDGLIDCPEDVKELRSTQVLPKALGDDQEVTNFFNTVGTLSAPSLYYNDVLENIESHCQSRWRPSTAKFWDKHFNSPWTTVSFLIAIFLYVNTVATASKNFFGIRNNFF